MFAGFAVWALAVIMLWLHSRKHTDGKAGMVEQQRPNDQQVLTKAELGYDGAAHELGSATTAPEAGGRARSELHEQTAVAELSASPVR